MNDPQLDPVQPHGDASPNPYEAGFTEPPKKTRGCFFYGCIIALVLGALALIAFAAGGYILYSWWSKVVQDYTATAPAEIPTVKLNEEDQKALDERVAAFKKALDAGESADLVLSADDINALIDENKDSRGKVFVTIKGDAVSAQVSILLDPFGIPLTKGRYLNGSGSITGKIEEGELIVHLQNLEVNGQKLPPDMMAQLGRNNLAKGFNDNPDMYRYIRKFESLRVKDGKVYIKAKARAKDDADDEAKPKSDADDAPKAKPDGDDAPITKPEPKDDAPKAKSDADDAPKAKPEPKDDAPKAKSDADDAPKAKLDGDDAPKAKPEPKDDAPKAAA